MKKTQSSRHIDIGFVVFLLMIGIIGYRNFQYYRTFWFLRHLERQQIHSVKIYSDTTRPAGREIALTSFEPIIPELLESFKGSWAVWLPHRFAVADSFFLEIITEEREIQGVFRIPKGKTYIIGEFGKWRQSSQTFYGEFRSKKLYQWYQKYSNRWLESEGSPPPPTPQPDSPGGE